MASMIKRLWNDRRGASAWVVTVAMVPLLGMVSLGTEVGSWHVTRRHAQNAADAAAIAGATALAVNDPTGAVTAGQAFANSNGFATGGGCPSTATTGQTVCITPSGTGAGHDGHGRRHTVRDADLYPMVRSSRSGQDTGHSSCRNTNKARVLYPRTQFVRYQWQL